MREARLVSTNKYRDYLYYIECVDEIYFWYLHNDSVISMGWVSETLCAREAENHIVHLIIERGEDQYPY